MLSGITRTVIIRLLVTCRPTIRLRFVRKRHSSGTDTLESFDSLNPIGDRNVRPTGRQTLRGEPGEGDGKDKLFASWSGSKKISKIFRMPRRSCTRITKRRKQCTFYVNAFPEFRIFRLHQKWIIPIFREQIVFIIIVQTRTMTNMHLTVRFATDIQNKAFIARIVRENQQTVFVEFYLLHSCI